MAHVGIERLTAGQSQEYAAQHDEERGRACDRKAHRFARIERLEDRRRRPDVDDAEDADNDKPHDHDRPEQPPDASGPTILKSKKSDQNDERCRHDEARGIRAELHPSMAERTEIAGVITPSP